MWISPSVSIRSLPPLLFDVSSPHRSAPTLQAGAILKAEIHGIPRAVYASNAAKVAEVAAKVSYLHEMNRLCPSLRHGLTPSLHSKVSVEPFQPRKGVHIETDPKAEKKALPTAADDESIIEGLLAKLAEAKGSLPEGYKLSPVQVGNESETEKGAGNGGYS